MQKKLLVAAFAAALLAVPAAGSAQVSVGVAIAPPAPRYEAVPPPRAGWAWDPGHWGWYGGHYAWVRGRWIAERAGYRWVPGHWAARGPQWYWVRGHWAPV